MNAKHFCTSPHKGLSRCRYHCTDGAYIKPDHS